MKKLLIILLFFLWIPPLFTQNTSSLDSLEQALMNAENPIIRSGILLELTKIYGQQDFDKALDYGHQTVVEVQKTKDDSLKYFANFELAKLYLFGTTTPRKGLAFTNVALEAAQGMEDSDKMIGCYILLAVIHNFMELPPKALDYFIKAKELAEQTENWSRLGTIYNNIGQFYSNQTESQEENARTYLLKAIEIYDKTGKEQAKITTYINLSSVTSDAEAALAYAFQAADLMEKEPPDIITKAYCYTEIATVYADKKGAFPESNLWFHRTRQLAEKANNPNYLSAAWYGLARNHYQLEAMDSAQFYLEKVWTFLEGTEGLGNLKEVASLLAKVHQEKAQWQQAFEFAQQASGFKDSIYSEQIANALSEHNAKLQAEQREKDIADQQLKIERQQNERNLLIGCGIVILIVITAIFQWYFYRQRRKKQAAELAFQRQKLESENLRALDAVKTRFFANISHELRTPLTLITAPLENVLTGIKQPNHRKDIELAHRNSKRLLTLVNELLDLSKLEAGKLKLQSRTINLHDLMRRIFFSFDSLAKLKELNLVFEYDLPPEVIAKLDVNKFEKILNNLLSNAIKYSKPGGEVRLHSFGVDSTALIVQVKDSGRGIHVEDLPYVFDRFYQSTSGRLEGGTGIGLALSKELAKLFGGDLKVESQVGEGSTFTFQMPLETIDAIETKQEKKEDKLVENFSEKVAIGSSKPPLPLEIKSTRNTILIVEDNPEMANFLQRTLQTQYDCTVASNGKLALDLLEKHSFDLITSDVMMPEMDGFEFRARINKRVEWRQLPFILLTARALEADKLQGFQLGVDDYITKPFSTPELLARIANLLQNKAERDNWRRENASENAVHTLPDTAEVQLLKNAERIVLENLDRSEFKVIDLAKKVGYSQRQLSRLLKKATGLSPVAFMLEIRLQRAFQLLESRQFLTVSEVRYEVGIESASYFTTKFKERFGRSPKEML